MGKPLNYAIPRGTTPKGTPAEPRDDRWKDTRPLGPGRLAAPAPRAPEQQLEDAEWRRNHADGIKGDVRRQAGNVREF